VPRPAIGVRISGKKRYEIRFVIPVIYGWWISFYWDRADALDVRLEKLQDRHGKHTDEGGT
jgi:hypothetical protein